MSLKYFGRIATLSAVIGALALLGAGCFQAANKASEAVIQPVNVPLAALNKAKQDLGNVQTGLNRQGEAFSDEVTVALILTEGAAVPEFAEVGGTIGCNDRVAFTKIKRVAQTDDLVSDVLKTLLAIGDKTPTGFYNALASSRVTLDRVVNKPDGMTDIYLKGQFLSGGVCDDPRIKAQIEETVKRITGKFTVFLNGTAAGYRCFGDMSGKCK